MMVCGRSEMDEPARHPVSRSTGHHFQWQRWLPVTFAPAGFRFQPIDIGDVADRPTALAAGEPVGRAPGLGGPQVRTMRDLARAYHSIAKRRRPVLSPRVAGAIARGYAAGWNLVPDNPSGTVTFERFLLERFGNGVR